VLLAEPGGFRGAMNLPAWSSSAQAAETIPQHPAGFADLVAKVKPAVISVRVKTNSAANTTSSGENRNGNILPFRPNSQFGKFFSSSDSRTCRMERRGGVG